jgi:uncharacterized protein
MLIVQLIGLVLVNLLWLAASIVGLPGTWLMAVTTLGFVWWTWDAAAGWASQPIGLPVMIALVVLAVIGEIVEFVAGMAGARRAGASVWGAIGALIGSIVGAVVGTFTIPLPIVGSLLGACGGAAAGAWLVETSRGRPPDQAAAVGTSAAIGRLQGTLAKLGIGVVMWLLIVAAAIWP